MSKFFRSNSSSSSSSGQDNDDDQAEELDHSSANNTFSDSAATLSRSNQLSPTSSEQPTDNAPHQSLLLHALLESWAISNAEKEQRHHRHQANGFGHASDTDIKARGEAKYRSLVSRLAGFGLVPQGFEESQYASTRKQYRDGLKAFSKDEPSESVDYGDVPVMMRRLLTGVNDGPLHNMQTLLLASSSADTTSLPPAPFQSHPLVQSSRFERDFEELGVLGKGGYGIVHRARHRLDGRQYAVKKIPISSSRLQRIKLRGESELDDLLREVKTLADLEHHNIVRYYSSWIEWTTLGHTNYMSDNGLTRSQESSEFQAWPPTIGGAADGRPSNTASFGPTATIDNLDDIVFEDSVSIHSTHSKKSHLTAASDKSDAANGLTKVRSRGTAATVSDEDDVESITRESDASASFSTDGEGRLVKSEPTLALHIQMALYPLTLGDFLSPPATAPDQVVAPLRHCFHLQPSAQILLAILDGLEYLHTQGVVHRDIKPGNIFMAAHQSPRATSTAVDLFLCDDCRAKGTAQPVMTKVRIGDFGLVTTVVGESEPQPSFDEDVGTALYRPTDGKTQAGRHLDIFALGIVAFELLWKFDTRMERLEILQQLRRGHFPANFAEACGHGSDEMEQCIRLMLFGNGGGVPSIEDFKQRLRKVITC
ncbi:hypothetical protein MBLNU230_g1785t1 [Neophaeotheca triangularis]